MALLRTSYPQPVISEATWKNEGTWIAEGNSYELSLSLDLIALKVDQHSGLLFEDFSYDMALDGILRRVSGCLVRVAA